MNEMYGHCPQCGGVLDTGHTFPCNRHPLSSIVEDHRLAIERQQTEIDSLRASLAEKERHLRGRGEGDFVGGTEMIYYRCKCGHCQSIGSMPPNPCQQCEKCGSDLARSPDLHRPPQDHDWETALVDTDAGMQELTICRWCHTKKVDWIKMRAEQLTQKAEEPNA